MMGNIYFTGGTGGGVDPDDCTATPAQVLEGHTAGVNGYDDPVEGTMPYQKQEGTLNCGQSSIILPGYHDGTRSITANSLASQTPGTSSAANIYPGQTAWVNGNKITGTMATQGGGTYTAGTADKTVVAANRFVTGNVVVKGDANLTAGNIKKGVKIMGITGSWEGYVPTHTIPYNRGVFGPGYGIAGSVIPRGSGSNLAKYTFLSNCIRIQDAIGGGAYCYFSLRSMNNINSVNLAYQSTTAVEIGIAPGLVMVSGQLDDSSFVIRSRGEASFNSEKVITINVSALTNDHYILFGGYVGRTGYIDICKIWYT